MSIHYRESSVKCPSISNIYNTALPQRWSSIQALSQIPLRYLGRRQVRGWSQTGSELEFGLSSSSLAAS